MNRFLKGVVIFISAVLIIFAFLHLFTRLMCWLIPDYADIEIG